MLDQLITPFEQFGGNKDHRSRTVTDLLVLELSKIDQETSGRVFYFELGQDCGSIVGDCDVADVIDEHFVETDGAQGRLDNVGDCDCCRHITVSYVCSALASSLEELNVTMMSR